HRVIQELSHDNAKRLRSSDQRNHQGDPESFGMTLVRRPVKSRQGPPNDVIRAAVTFLTICSSFTVVVHASAASGAAHIPDFSGQWGRAGLFRFEPPQSGPGPVTNTSRFADTIERVGDYTNPILTPRSAEIVKQRGDLQLAGANFPDPRNQCRPEPPPFILALEFEIRILQRPDEIDFQYVYGNQLRRIRMNASHSRRV